MSVAERIDSDGERIHSIADGQQTAFKDDDKQLWGTKTKNLRERQQTTQADDGKSIAETNKTNA